MYDEKSLRLKKNIFSENEGLLKNYLPHLLVKLGKTAFDYSLLRSLFFSAKVFPELFFPVYNTVGGVPQFLEDTCIFPTR